MTDIVFFAGGSGSYGNRGERDRRSPGGSEGKHNEVSRERVRLVQVGER